QVALHGEVARLLRAADLVVIGDGDNIEVGVVFGVIEESGDALEAVHLIRVEMDIRPPGSRQAARQKGGKAETRAASSVSPAISARSASADVHRHYHPLPCLPLLGV